MIPNRCVDMQHFLYLKYYIWSELLVCIQANDKNDSVGSETHKDCAEISQQSLSGLKYNQFTLSKELISS